MLWMTWRQFRAQTIAAVAAMAATALVLGLSGLRIAHLYRASGIADCRARNDCAAVASNFLTGVNGSLVNHLPLLFGTALVAVPAIIGIFWGAPLVTREVEPGTHRLAWTQGITRTRWLTVNLIVIGLASMAAAGLFSLLVTWSASPIDAVNMNWLQPAVFSERGIAPVGYAAFAFALGVATGMLIRRTVPAMAVTLAAFTAVQFAMRALRQYLIAPVHLISPITAVTSANITMSRSGVGQMSINGAVNMPGAWILANDTTNAAGHAVSGIPIQQTGALSLQTCGTAQGNSQACLAALYKSGYRQLVVYQPASRFWAFQWYETAIFLALALALAGFCLLRIRRLS
jgi:ABC-type transport system involved in multi-copper enzyme maturation permease subunit